MSKEVLNSISCINQIEEFLKNPKHLNRQWFQDDDMKVYIRFNASHYIRELGLVKTFDIATIEVDEDKKGSGIFTKFLSDVSKIVKEDIIYIENVLEIRLANHLENNGWILLNKESVSLNGPPCFYKKVEKP